MKEDLYRPQRNWGARILEYRYKGLRAVFLENELLRVGIIADKGTDVFEFNYKPKDMDFVWLTAGGVRNPTSYLSTSSDPLATFMDYYPGGWQEISPNGGAPSSYLWFWQEYGASEFYPWYGRHYNIGLERFSSFPTNGLQEAVNNGTALSLGARERRHFSLQVEVLDGGHG
jgi:hypothetical protein